MQYSRLVLVLMFPVLVGGGLAACQRAGESDLARTEEGVLRLGPVEVVDTVRRAVAPSGRPLVVKGLRGSVRLEGTRRSTASLLFLRRGRGKSRDAAQSVLKGISITERGTESAYTFTLEARRETHAAVDVRGQVPRSTTLRSDRRSGAVHVGGVEGAITIKHKHGDVAVQGAAAPVKVTVQNGDVQVGFRTVPSEGPLLLQTSNGNVQVRLPSGASTKIDAQTNVGVIKTQGLSVTNERYTPVNAGARYDAQLGRGGPTLEIRTQNGTISIRARDTTRSDTLDANRAPTSPTSDTTGPAPVPADTPATDTTAENTEPSDTTGG